MDQDHDGRHQRGCSDDTARYRPSDPATDPATDQTGRPGTQQPATGPATDQTTPATRRQSHRPGTDQTRPETGSQTRDRPDPAARDSTARTQSEAPRSDRLLTLGLTPLNGLLERATAVQVAVVFDVVHHPDDDTGH